MLIVGNHHLLADARFENFIAILLCNKLLLRKCAFLSNKPATKKCAYFK